MIDYTKDTHIHTNYSPDANPSATFEKYIKRAKKLGLKELVFTEHVDFDAVHPLFHKMIDYDEYVAEFNKAKESSSIPIRLGVEIGYQEHVTNDINDFIDEYDFEHVILSIHYIEKKDFYTGEYFSGKTKKEAYSIYFDTCIKAVKEISKFDVFGHLDYITRYSNMGEYEYEEYKHQIDELLQLLISKNKGIEINYSDFKKTGKVYPKKQVIDRFIELGGTKIVLGSDSHSIDNLGIFLEKK